MNKEYWVNLPIAGVLSVNVKADSEEQAIEKALEANWNMTLEQGDGEDMELTELDAYDKLVTGNVVHAPLWEAEAEES